jgi:hypothetical protein
MYIMKEKRTEAASLLFLVLLAVLFFANVHISYAKPLMPIPQGECHFKCQNTNTTGPGTTTCSPTNSQLYGVLNNEKSPIHQQCEQNPCGKASYSGSGGSGQEDRCKEMPGMPPMLPMPMPKPKMPMPNQDECMKPEKINTKECKCKDPNNADDPICKEGKATTTLNFFGTTTDSKATQKSIVEYGKDLFSKFFGNDKGEEDKSSEESIIEDRGVDTTVRNTTNLNNLEPTTYQTLQPPQSPASPSLNNTDISTPSIPTNTFGAAQDFAVRAEVAEAPGGIVSRIGAGARAIVDNLRRFFGLGG